MTPPEEYKVRPRDVTAIVEAVDSFSGSAVARTLAQICTRVHREGQMSVIAGEVPADIQEVLLNATGAYEALRLGLGDRAVEVFLPGVERCEERLKAVLQRLGVG